MKNQMAFKCREQADNLIKYLLDYNTSNEDEFHYNDIHIYQEEDLIIVEWVQVPYEHDYGGSFEFVDEGQVVMIEFTFPDGTCGYEFSEGEKEKRIEYWLKEHPTWKQDNFGRWYDEKR